MSATAFSANAEKPGMTIRPSSHWLRGKRTTASMMRAAANEALLQSVAVGGTNLVFTLLALSVIDRFGRVYRVVDEVVDGYAPILGALEDYADTLEERIFEVVIPMEDVMEFKGGKKQVVQKKVFPGYLLVKMLYDNDSWYVVRNTPGVTGFVSAGTGTKPTPLSKREVEKILVVKSTIHYRAAFEPIAAEAELARQ